MRVCLGGPSVLIKSKVESCRSCLLNNSNSKGPSIGILLISAFVCIFIGTMCTNKDQHYNVVPFGVIICREAYYKY